VLLLLGSPANASTQSGSWSKSQSFPKNRLDSNGIRIKTIKASYNSKTGLAMTDITFWDTPDPSMYGVYVYWAKQKNCLTSNLKILESGDMDALMGHAVPWNSATGDQTDQTGYQAVFDPIWGTDTTSSFYVVPVSPNEVIYKFMGSQLKNRGFSCVDVLPNEPPYVDPLTGIVTIEGNAGYDISERFLNK